MTRIKHIVLSAILMYSAVQIATPEAFAQVSPDLKSWILNRTNETGYNGILSNVQKLFYSDDNMYVSCTCIPGYDIGPWTGNPNLPANQDFTFKLTRHAVENTGTLTATPLGHIGVWSNGVSIFNASDARSYQNQNVWHQNAIVVEGPGFDNCMGHPQQNGEYHNHLSPRCLYDETDNSRHSPIIGFAFDGFPIYGCWGNTNSDGTGTIIRMRSSYHLRNITARKTLASGQAVSAGPAIASPYVLGYYSEDYEFVDGSGDLDEHNGRFCVTPEYPAGTYAYFTTVGEDGKASYPYTLGTTYYGTVPAGNTGMGSGHNTPQESVTEFTGDASVQKDFADAELTIYPNPADQFAHITLAGPVEERALQVLDLTGKVLRVTSVWGNTLDLTTSDLPSGSYILRAEGNKSRVSAKLIITRK